MATRARGPFEVKLAPLTTYENADGSPLGRLSLNGRSGSFVLQHSGTMTRGVPGLVITVVPDTGTEELTGLAGTMSIIIEAGKHSYDFEYTLAE